MSEYIDFPAKLRSTRADGKIVDTDSLDGNTFDAIVVGSFGQAAAAGTQQARIALKRAPTTEDRVLRLTFAAGGYVIAGGAVTLRIQLRRGAAVVSRMTIANSTGIADLRGMTFNMSDPQAVPASGTWSLVALTDSGSTVEITSTIELVVTQGEVSQQLAVTLAQTKQWIPAADRENGRVLGDVNGILRWILLSGGTHTLEDVRRVLGLPALTQANRGHLVRRKPSAEDGFALVDPDVAGPKLTGLPAFRELVLILEDLTARMVDITPDTRAQYQEMSRVNWSLKVSSSLPADAAAAAPLFAGSDVVRATPPQEDGWLVIRSVAAEVSQRSVTVLRLTGDDKVIRITSNRWTAIGDAGGYGYYAVRHGAGWTEARLEMRQYRQRWTGLLDNDVVLAAVEAAGGAVRTLQRAVERLVMRTADLQLDREDAAAEWEDLPTNADLKIAFSTTLLPTTADIESLVTDEEETATVPTQAGRRDFFGYLYFRVLHDADLDGWRAIETQGGRIYDSFPPNDWSLIGQHTVDGTEYDYYRVAQAGWSPGHTAKFQRQADPGGVLSTFTGLLESRRVLDAAGIVRGITIGGLATEADATAGRIGIDSRGRRALAKPVLGLRGSPARTVTWVDSYEILLNEPSEHTYTSGETYFDPGTWSFWRSAGTGGPGTSTPVPVTAPVTIHGVYDSKEEAEAAITAVNQYVWWPGAPALQRVRTLNNVANARIYYIWTPINRQRFRFPRLVLHGSSNFDINTSNQWEAPDTGQSEIIIPIAPEHEIWYFRFVDSNSLGRLVPFRPYQDLYARNRVVAGTTVVARTSFSQILWTDETGRVVHVYLGLTLHHQIRVASTDVDFNALPLEIWRPV